ncbi:hypothetical protein CAI16_15225 [Virgibacillus dokdonensis]|uniref:Uncharacterized protein n=1 Tax=Virgibacillus dokdonensis TaxID=302167 RepID=A0A3E0WM62_9BACI|nr:hypothetical protein [Virgibacillus dokdonensis]RFA33303.1 hypothetical protein CAI16_15225 [Virgibacillus dokdonensis]
MDNLTVSEWMKENGLTDDEVDFIETILTSTAMQESGIINYKEINRKINTYFPEKRFYLTGKINFEKFLNILKENEIFIDLKELLNRYHSQGTCKEHCEKLLERV